MQDGVSIVIPCYNHGHFLREAVASVERVRNPNLREVIVVDDGSTEPEAIHLFGELEKAGHRVIHQANRGLAAARNAGIAAAGGEFILSLDNDNRIREPYLREGADLLRNDASLGAVYGDAEYFGEKSGRWTVPEFDAPELLRINYIDNCALFRRRMWEEVGGYDETMPYMGWEDWDFWLRCAFRGWGFARLNQVAFDYRVRAGSMLSNADKHADEILAHMFAKRELSPLESVRERLWRLRAIEDSFEYRWGKRLFAPLRALKNAAARRR